MSTSWKVFIGVLVIVGALFGFNYIMNLNNESPAVTDIKNTQVTQPTQPTANTTDSVTASINSSTSLDQDLSSIDAQINAVNANSAQVDSSLNDKPVAQTE